MRYQHKADSTHSMDEILKIETEAHDEEYMGKMPYGLKTLTFTKEEVWKINDHAYKPGTYVRGWRKRRLFQLMELDNMRGKRILDVGCGQGQHSVFFAMHGAEVYGFDLSSAGIEMAKQTAQANGVAHLCHFRTANVSEMPYDAGFFDAVVYNAVLHHVIKYPNVKEETFRVLRPGGKLFIAEGIRDNSLYRFMRGIKHRLAPAHFHGDVDLEMSDLYELTDNYQSRHFDRFCLLEKFAQGFARPYNNGRLVRAMLKATNATDDVLLKALPSLRTQCLEVVGVAIK